MTSRAQELVDNYAMKLGERDEEITRLANENADLMAALIDAENMLDQIRHLRVLENDTWDAIDKTVDKARAALAKAEAT